jgi:glucose-1-phosphate adenylyltransferase
MNKVFGIIFSNMHDRMIKELTTDRCMGSLPVGGRYRLVDFTLSSFSHAGAKRVAIITKSNYRSLLQHIGSGRQWDLANKQGGLMILPPAAISDSGAIYNGRVEALAGIMSILDESPCNEVVCADCDLMANIDFTEFAKFHRESGADISLIYAKRFNTGADNRELLTLDVAENGNVKQMFIQGITGEQPRGKINEYLNICMIGRDLLKHLIRGCISQGLYSFDKDVLLASTKSLKVKAWEHKGTTLKFSSVADYFTSNMALLNPAVRNDIFDPERPVYTRVKDEAPVRYGYDCKVENSLIADGCIIDGEVENSILFRGVTVGKGAIVRNCILMRDTFIGAHTRAEHLITDGKVSMRDHRTAVGLPDYPMYIRKGVTV